MVAEKQLPEVELLPLEETDLVTIAAGNLQAFPTFYAPLEPEANRPDHDTRVRRQATRLRKVIANPLILGVKAVLASGPEKGKLVGHALWHRPGAPVVNLKKRLTSPEEETEEEKESWEGVDTEKWNGKWGEWDVTRARIMKGVPHWYIAPLWVIPGYQGLGIGSKLMQQVLDLADAEEPTTPVYLEASPSTSKPPRTGRRCTKSAALSSRAEEIAVHLHIPDQVGARE
ncbi:hypothetical protein JCM11251_004320 [Rhodosporidiobolus azoricus]